MEWRFGTIEEQDRFENDTDSLQLAKAKKKKENKLLLLLIIK